MGWGSSAPQLPMVQEVDYDQNLISLGTKNASLCDGSLNFKINLEMKGRTFQLADDSLR